MVALTKVAIRNREQLATLRVRDGVMVMETMLWPDEVREPAFPFVDQDVEVRPQELAMARSLIESMAGDFDPSQYTDQYREALQEVIDAKVQGRQVVEPEAAQPNAGNVVDLMSALRASVEAARRGRGQPAESAAEDANEDESAEPRKTSAKRAPAKKAATKAPAKKAAAKAPAKKAASAATKTAAKKSSRKSA
jgi:DNA end-binding protein Ku